MDPKVIKKTQDTLGAIIKKPPLTEKLLSKPPFRFLHDVMTSVIKTTGFMQGLFADGEMNSENVKDKEAKVAFLQKAIDMVCAVTGKSLAVKPLKIVAGHEPEKTNELLQVLAAAINKNVDNDEYVRKVLKGGGDGQPKEEKKESQREKEKDRTKSADRRKTRDGEKKESSDKDKNKEERSRDRGEKDRSKDRDREKDGDREKDRERKHDKDRDRHRDRDSKTRDKSRDGREERHKDRERSKKRAKSPRSSPKKSPSTKETHHVSSERTEPSDMAQTAPNDSTKNDPFTLTQTCSNVGPEWALNKVPSIPANTKEGHKPAKGVAPLAENETEVCQPLLTAVVNGGSIVQLPVTSPRKGRSNCQLPPQQVPASPIPVGSCRMPGAKLLPSPRSGESLATGDHNMVGIREKENESPDRDKVNGEAGDKQEAPSKLQRPSSAKGSRRRREAQNHTTTHEDDEFQKSMAPSNNAVLGEGDLPPQVAAARLARPSSARPAPPRPKQDETEPAMRLGAGAPTNLIVDDDNDEDEDENFLVEETAPPPPEPDLTPSKPTEEDDTEHGALVKKMLESKKELEGGNQQTKKTEIERPIMSDAQRRKQREQVQKEVDKLRTSIQSLTRSANPLGKVMDYVQEDLDAMQQELDKWRSENGQHALDLKREMNVTDRAIEPLRQQLSELDKAISDQLGQIAACKSNIIKNDQRIQRMLRGISGS